MTKDPTQPEDLSSSTTILIVTPTFNSQETVARTILSVVSQQGDFELIYHIQDGGSKDSTLEVCQKLKSLVDMEHIPRFCKKITFNISSEADNGMYDAIWKAFETYKIYQDGWMAWINSDDILRPGACSLLPEIDKQHGSNWIKWIGGSTSVCDGKTGMQIGHGKRPHNRYAIKHGLCEGVHWDFIQQEGVFFRKKLWDSIDNTSNFRSYRYAGDWNLWRVFAEKAEFFQTPWATGSFFRVEGQISGSTRFLYEAEICSTLAPAIRQKSLFDMSDEDATGYLIGTAYTTSEVFITKTVQKDVKQKWLAKHEDSSLSKPKTISKEQPDMYHFSDKLHLNAVANKSIIIHPSDWQYPAITEKHAAAKAIELLPEKEGYCYFGFPWATLVDMIECGDNARMHLFAILGEYREKIMGNERVFTTCQHVLQHKYDKLLRWAGITDVFWSHHTTDSSREIKGLRCYPFPLYPLQAVLYEKGLESASSPPNSEDNRIIMCSFAGARFCDGYISPVRDWIVNHLSSRDGIKIVSRSHWHYQIEVYGNQVRSGINLSSKESQEVVQTQAQNAAEYISIMRDSQFSLCPSGSGPNSIRLWESIMLGTIPIILSDLQILPGSSSLWKNSTVCIPETEESVVQIPYIIRSFSDSQLKSLHEGLANLRMLYGSHTFISDVLGAWLGQDIATTKTKASHSEISEANQSIYHRINRIAKLSVPSEKKKKAITALIHSESRIRPQALYAAKDAITQLCLSLEIPLEKMFS